MTGPNPAELDAALEASWPPARSWTVDQFTFRDGQGGGKRVSAATLKGAFEESALAPAVAEFTRLGRAVLFRIREDETPLDAALAAQGYAIVDPTVFFAAPAASLIDPDQPPLAAVSTETLLGIQKEIWAAGGVGPERLSVMLRVTHPHAWLLARRKDRAAGAGFVALHKQFAMVHALETLPVFRRTGAARSMIHRAAKWALARGATDLGLAVTETNEPAIRLYESLGMTRVGRYHYRQKPLG